MSNVKQAHSDAREAFLLWQAHGKPRHGPFCTEMNKTRAKFKHCLRYCKSVEDKARADAIAKKFLQKDQISFWKEIKKLRYVGNDACASTIDGVTGQSDICNMWRDHYSSLLNSNSDSKHKPYIENVLSGLGASSDFTRISYCEVNEAIKDLKLGKSCGIDNLQGEHFRYADSSLSVLLSMCFNTMLLHGYIPSKLMQTIIVPIIKDKKGLITSKDNYRPVAITSVASKIVELILLTRLEDVLKTSCNQFGFKNKLGTDFCIFTLKQIIEYYKYKNSPVYVCFLDASKAFDRINHWSLFAKLAKRGIELVFLRFLVYWYRKQEFCVRWGTNISSFFTVSNGVRQGGIMSPILFNVYMDDLSSILNMSKIGCYFNGTLYNHIMYADDTCILAPSPSALHKLLHQCATFADENTIVFNTSKSKYMCFKPKCLSKLKVPDVFLNGEVVPQVGHTKYLGVIIENNVSDDLDIMRHIKAIYARGNVMISRFKICTDDVKRCLFQSYISSSYGSQLWTTYSPNIFKKAKVAYNNICRSFFSLKRDHGMSEFYVHHNLDAFIVLYRKTIGNFLKRLKNCDNELVKTIVLSVFFAFNSSQASITQQHLYT